MKAGCETGRHRYRRAGKFGKPRPALALQADGRELLETLTYLPITSDLLHAPDLRVPITATAENGLRLDSQVMVDMIQTSSLAKFGPVIGHVDALMLIRVEAALSMHLGLVDGRGRRTDAVESEDAVWLRE